MKKLAILLTSLLFSACAPMSPMASTSTPTTIISFSSSTHTSAPSTSPPSSVSTIPLPATSSPLSTNVQIAMVDLADAVTEPHTQAFGCGDQIVMVNRTVNTTTPLQTALEELFRVRTRDYGQSGYITALDDQDLRVNRVNITNGVATIELSGTIRFGGTCDVPRVQEQVNRTIRQFSSVRDYRIVLNGSERNWQCLFDSSGNC